jgi:hypothetical protein
VRLVVLSALLVLLLCLTLVLAHERILLAIGDFLVVRDDLRPADVIHALRGGLDRIDYAVELCYQGYAGASLLAGAIAASIRSDLLTAGASQWGPRCVLVLCKL